MFKYDLHVHTDETSSCGKVRASEMVDLYLKEGYTGVVITDHYYKGFFEKRCGSLNWNEKIDRYLEGYNNALKAAAGKDFDVLLGMELKFDDSDNEYLVFGIDECFLRENMELYKLELKKFRQLIEDKDILIFQAHPFRTNMTRAKRELIDGIEVYNGNPRHDSNNETAYRYAVENDLMMVSGSDFHQICDLARGGIEVEQRITTSKKLVDVIKRGGVKKLIKCN